MFEVYHCALSLILGGWNAAAIGFILPEKTGSGLVWLFISTKLAHYQKTSTFDIAATLKVKNLAGEGVDWSASFGDTWFPCVFLKAARLLLLTTNEQCKEETTNQTTQRLLTLVVRPGIHMKCLPPQERKPGIH